MVTPRRDLPPSGGFFGGVSVTAQEIGRIRSLSREGRTLDSIQSTLRAEGIPVRRQAISEIRNEFLRLQSRSPGIASIPLDFRPGPQTLTPVRINLATEFRYSASVTARNPLTGETRQFFMRFGSNTLATRRQILDRTLDIFAQGQSNAPDGSGSEGFDDILSTDIFAIEQRTI